MMKILVTGGGSEEPIDNVRFVCNFSTGKTSSFIADFFASAGFDVTAIMAEKAVKPEKARILTYKTFAQLKNLLETECRSGNYDAVIHAAAVSDYSPETIIAGGQEFKAGTVSKLPAGEELIIKMRKNPKLVDSIKLWTKTGNDLNGKNCQVIAFKLTSNADLEQRETAVKKIFSANSNPELAPDFVVSNDLSEINGAEHICRIYKKNMTVRAKVSNLNELAEELKKIAEE